MDRNQATGLILMSVLLLGYFLIFSDQPEQPEVANDASVEQVDSIQSNTTKDAASSESSNPVAAENELSDSARAARMDSKFGLFAQAMNSTEEEKLIPVKTPLLDIVFSNGGGYIKTLVLNDFETFDGRPLQLISPEYDSKEFIITTTKGEINLFDLTYELESSLPESIEANDTISLDFVADLGAGKKIIQTYRISGNGYEIGHDFQFKGLDQEIISDVLKVNWSKKMLKYEKDLEQNRTKATINYYTAEEGMDGLSETDETDELSISAPVKWINFKQNFFSSALISELGINRIDAKVTSEGLSDNYVKAGQFAGEVNLDSVNSSSTEFKYYFGPNNYKILQKTAVDFEDNINLGWFPISLVNKYLIINVFQLLEQYISSYGIIIIILVLIIKLALSPLSYKSYVSMAKTKVLKPQLDAIKEKYDGDMQKSQPEQMELYRKVGVNPLSGCIPLLLQMPILFAMFYFFPSSIELRQESFLWAQDLSSYDSILSLPFEIPFYGDHVSLFTLLMTASTLLITWSQGQVSSAQGPMKNIQYIMPVIFMFVLNNFPAALSFYYFVANLITFGQQTLIRRMIDEDKILKILEENKKKNANKKTSKFQQRLQEAMKAAEENKKSKKNKK